MTQKLIFAAAGVAAIISVSAHGSSSTGTGSATRIVVRRLIRDFQRQPDRHRDRSPLSPGSAPPWCGPRQSIVQVGPARSAQAPDTAGHQTTPGAVSSRHSSPPGSIGHSRGCRARPIRMRHHDPVYRMSAGSPVVAQPGALPNARPCTSSGSAASGATSRHQWLGGWRTADRFVRQFRLLTDDLQEQKSVREQKERRSFDRRFSFRMIGGAISGHASV